MISSDGFGGGAAGARPRVQVCPTTGTESGTIIPAQQKVTRHRQRQLFPHDGCNVDARRPGRQWVEVGIVRSIGVTRENCCRNVDVHLLEHLGEAAAALATDDRMDAPSPEVFPLAGRLKLPIDQDITNHVEVESLEGRIARVELPFGAHGTALQVPNIHSQHSPLR
jgi:hypothetical protein